METILVVCYSRGGNTRRVAQAIQSSLGADFEQIEEPQDRSGGLGYARSLLEAVTKGVPSIRVRKDPAAYDLVILGTPVWAGTMASPMRSYLMLQRQRLQNVAFFCTMGGRGGNEALAEMAALCCAESAPRLVVTQSEVEGERYRERLDGFMAGLKTSRQSQVTRAVA